MSSPGRRYSAREVAAILKAAASGSEGRELPAAGGLTLPELIEAARELGIEPASIVRAAETETGDGGALSRLLGAPAAINTGRLLPVAVTEDQWPLLLQEIRAATGLQGVPGRAGSAFEWSATEAPRLDELHVSVLPGPEGARLRVVSRHGGLAGMLLVWSAPVALLAGWALTGLLHGSAPLEIGASVLLSGGLLAAARAGAAAFCRRRERQVRRLLDGVAASLEPAGAVREAAEAAAQADETDASRQEVQAR